MSIQRVAVLVVCTGNICRSPTGEGVMRHLARNRGLGDRVRVASAGTHDYHVGESPDPRTLEHAAKRGYDLSEQRAAQVRKEDFDAFDYILDMDRTHLRILRSMQPEGSKAKLGLFLEASGKWKGEDVPDPYYGGVAGFEQVLDMAEEAGERWLDRIEAELDPAAFKLQHSRCPPARSATPCAYGRFRKTSASSRIARGRVCLRGRRKQTHGVHHHRQFRRRARGLSPQPSGRQIPVRRAGGARPPGLARLGVQAGDPLRRARRLGAFRGNGVLLVEVRRERVAARRRDGARAMHRFVSRALFAAEGGVPLRLRHAQARAGEERHARDRARAAALGPHACRLRAPGAHSERALRRDGAGVRMGFERLETFFASLDEGRRREKEISHALAALVHDHAARARFLALTRDTEDPAIRVRMIALARSVGWLSPAEQRAETARMIRDLLATDAVGYGEVDLICTLNHDRELDRELHRVKVAKLFANRPAYAAARACLGSAEARARVLRALASPNDQDVQVAQAYLRHHPITDSGELRAAASGIARMPDSAAQVRALETLARHHISDRETLEPFTRPYAQPTSVNVQRAIAEVFLRSDQQAIEVPRLVSVLREHRLESRGGGGLMEVLIGRLQGSSLTNPPP